MDVCVLITKVEYAVKLRIRFTKLEQSIYLSHLDIQRIFQLVLRMADIKVTYSKGFNPHIKMSFVSALGVGINSICECLDLECADFETNNYRDIIERINDKLIYGIKVLSIKYLDFEKEKKENYILDRCDYIIELLDSNEDIKCMFDNFLSKNNIPYIKQNKKKIEKEINIKEGILEYRYLEKINALGKFLNEYIPLNKSSNYFYLKLKSGNNNLSPNTLIKAFIESNFDIKYNIYRINMLNKYDKEIY